MKKTPTNEAARWSLWLAEDDLLFAADQFTDPQDGLRTPVECIESAAVRLRQAHADLTNGPHADGLLEAADSRLATLSELVREVDQMRGRPLDSDVRLLELASELRNLCDSLGLEHP